MKPRKSLSCSTEELNQLYNIEYLSPKEIGKLFDVSHETVRRRLLADGISQGRRPYIKLPSGEELAKLYVDEGLSLSAIGKRYNVSRRPIRNRLVSVGVTIRESSVMKVGHLGRMDILLDRETLTHLYFDEFLSLNEIASRYGVTRTVINRLLREYNIPKRSRRACKYRFNEFFFSVWSHDMSYVLGLIFADGNLSENSSQAVISNQDRELLESIAEAMQFNLSPVRGEGVFTFYIRSEKVKTDMQMYGLTPRKSLTMEFPHVPDPYLGSFIRGFFDGDGCVHIPTAHPNQLVASFASGSKKFIEALELKLQEYGLSARNIKFIKSKNGAYSITYGAKNDVRLLYRLLYSPPCHLFLERKKEIFDSLLPFSL